MLTNTSFYLATEKCSRLLFKKLDKYQNGHLKQIMYYYFEFL